MKIFKFSMKICISIEILIKILVNISIEDVIIFKYYDFF